MSRWAGVLRDAEGLAYARGVLDDLGWRAKPGAGFDTAAAELQNLVTVASQLVAAATLRAESRGTHIRTDEPDPDPAFLGRFFHVGDSCRFHPLPEREPV
jgi:aspartate oxidase